MRDEGRGGDHVLQLENASVEQGFFQQAVPLPELTQGRGQVLFASNDPDLFPHELSQGCAHLSDVLRHDGHRAFKRC